jgi:cytochrome c peroxidase
LEAELDANRHNGQRLFENETFGGNGRTCETCHANKGGTTSPADAQARFAADPDDPLFRSIDSDDGAGSSYDNLTNHALIRAKIPMTCSSITLKSGEPYAFILRGIPSTINTPALDPVLMLDGRAPDIEAQANGAIHDHYEPTEEPTADDLQHIGEYEQTEDFFSNSQLSRFANGGPLPELPPGNTDAEIRGRAHFLPAGACGLCHSGPMLNTVSEFWTPSSAGNGFAPGVRFIDLFVGRLAGTPLSPAPLQQWLIRRPDGVIVERSLPDPGRMLITCANADLNRHKIGSLWNAKDTAPYFHDNSANTLEDVIDFYKVLFASVNTFTTRTVFTSLTPSDFDDILAYQKIL